VFVRLCKMSSCITLRVCDPLRIAFVVAIVLTISREAVSCATDQNHVDCTFRNVTQGHVLAKMQPFPRKKPALAP
jgi:hypothetical protein